MHKILPNLVCILLFFSAFLCTETAAFAQEYVLPYPGYMPGNALYNLSSLIDRIEEYWSIGSFSKFSHHLKMADKKLVEAKTLFEYKQYLLASNAISSYELHLGLANTALDQAQREGKNISEKRRLFKSAISKHRSILENLREELPAEFLWQPEKEIPQILVIREILEQALRRGEEYNGK